jgi:hypothetical protein
MTDGSINICRPGFGASCCLCCGGLNYRAGRGELESLFRRRTALLARYSRDYVIRAMTASRSNMTGSYYFRTDAMPFIAEEPAIFEGLPRCPFVGFLADGTTAGCILHPGDNSPDLRHECFQSYRGKIFSCRARELLSIDEIRYAARLTRDWYYYGILIHDEDLLRGMMKDHPEPGEVPPKELEIMNRELEDRVASRRELHSVHSYFS